MCTYSNILYGLQCFLYLVSTYLHTLTYDMDFFAIYTQYVSDVFGPFTGDPGTHSSRPRGRQTLAGERGRGRVTEDRERRVGDQIFPALIITMGRREGQEYSRSTSYPPPTSPPFPSEPEVRKRWGGSSQQVDPWTRGGGKGSSQPAGPSNQEEGER